MSHAQIEEVSDSDLSDPSEGDIDDFVESDIMRQVAPPKAPTTTAQPPLVNPAHLPPQLQQQQQHAPQVQPSDIKDYQCIYPVYFDATRTRGTGRRVSSALAVKNPLAREIATACAQLRLQPVFEAHRTHPADWANPGRVKVPLKRIQAGAAGTTVKNKHHLYVLIAQHLQKNPTTEHCDALRMVRVPGLGVPEDGEPWPRPAVPRGWKMGELLPAYSAAMTGGGVSENAFKDMMKEMGGPGGAPGGAPGAGPGGMPPGMGGMGNMAEMMNMFGGMGGGGGGGGAGPSAGAVEGGGGGGGRKGKKGKK